MVCNILQFIEIIFIRNLGLKLIIAQHIKCILVILVEDSNPFLNIDMEKPYKYYLNLDEPNKSCLLALRDIILQYNELITETKKYNMPCFIYKKKAFCYLWTDKKTNEPYILFVDGNKLNHPELEVGNRSRMKILKINPIQDIPIETVKSILKGAISLHKT